jgi:hypothetical protein
MLLLFTCPECAAEKVLAMSLPVRQKHLRFIAEHNAKLMHSMLHEWSTETTPFQTKEENLLHAILVTAELHGRTLEEALVDLVMGDNQRN